MARAWRRLTMAAGALAILASGTTGCVATPHRLLIAGNDLDGRLVVGAVDCQGDGRDPVGRLVVTGTRGQRPPLWVVEWPQVGPDPADGEPATSPDPRPAVIDGVRMLVVGDPAPDGASVTLPLEGGLPESDVQVEAELAASGVRVGPIVVPTRGPRDTYAVVTEDSTRTGLSGADAADEIADHCSSDGFDAGAVGLTLLIATGAVVVLGVPLILFSARQNRRAKAASDLRSAGLPPGGP